MIDGWRESFKCREWALERHQLPLIYSRRLGINKYEGSRRVKGPPVCRFLLSCLPEDLWVHKGNCCQAVLGAQSWVSSYLTCSYFPE